VDSDDSEALVELGSDDSEVLVMVLHSNLVDEISMTFLVILSDDFLEDDDLVIDLERVTI
jgi:hypothetical protein